MSRPCHRPHGSVAGFGLAPLVPIVPVLASFYIFPNADGGLLAVQPSQFVVGGYDHLSPQMWPPRTVKLIVPFGFGADPEDRGRAGRLGPGREYPGGALNFAAAVPEQSGEIAEPSLRQLGSSVSSRRTGETENIPTIGTRRFSSAMQEAAETLAGSGRRRRLGRAQSTRGGSP